jgi:hypothetical protein
VWRDYLWSNEKYNFEIGSGFEVDNLPFLTDPTEQRSSETSPENEMSQFPKCYVLFGLTGCELNPENCNTKCNIP